MADAGEVGAFEVVAVLKVSHELVSDSFASFHSFACNPARRKTEEERSSVVFKVPANFSSGIICYRGKKKLRLPKAILDDFFCQWIEVSVCCSRACLGDDMSYPGEEVHWLLQRGPMLCQQGLQVPQHVLSQPCCFGPRTQGPLDDSNCISCKPNTFLACVKGMHLARVDSREPPTGHFDKWVELDRLCVSLKCRDQRNRCDDHHFNREDLEGVYWQPVFNTIENITIGLKSLRSDMYSPKLLKISYTMDEETKYVA